MISENVTHSLNQYEANVLSYIGVCHRSCKGGYWMGFCELWDRISYWNSWSWKYSIVYCI